MREHIYDINQQNICSQAIALPHFSTQRVILLVCQPKKIFIGQEIIRKKDSNGRVLGLANPNPPAASGLV